MTIRTISLNPNTDLSRRLTRIHAAWSSKRSDRTPERRTMEYMVYEEVFRSLAKEYREDLAHFELGKGASRMGQNGGRSRSDIPERANDPTSPRKEVYLSPGMVDWDSQRASRAPADGDLTIRFPADVLDRLERGLALRDAWTRQYPEGSNIKLYASFEEWAEEQVAEYVQREYDRLQDEEIAKEEDELYPGLNEKPKAAEQAPPKNPRPEIRPGQPVSIPVPAGPKWEPQFAGRSVDPHRPHRRGPTDR